MAEYSRFFDSTPSCSNRYSAADFAEFMKTFYSTGIIPEQDGEVGKIGLQVSVDPNTLSVIVSPGYAMVDGRWYSNTAPLTKAIAAADNTYSRIDRVVLRRDIDPEVEAVVLDVLTGIPAAKPSAPELTRNENTYEISLAQVEVKAHADRVSAVVDERYLADVCGISQGYFTLDFTDFDQQLQAKLEEIDVLADEAVEAITNMTEAQLLSMILDISGAITGINAEQLEGHPGSYYLDYTNLTNQPTLETLNAQRKILTGTTAPDASVGQDGDLFVLYS